MRAIETLRVIHFDRQRRVLHVAIYAGRRDEVSIPLRAVIADALRLNSAGLLLSHNHPSGDATPSRSDLLATRHLASAIAALDIRLHDHIVTGAESATSFRAQGWL